MTDRAVSLLLPKTPQTIQQGSMQTGLTGRELGPKRFPGSSLQELRNANTVSWHGRYGGVWLRAAEDRGVSRS